MTVCYLCGEPVYDGAGSGDHVIPRTLLGDRPPKVKGFDYGGTVRAHLECNNRFGDETHVRKALQLLGALHDSRTTFTRAVPGRLKGHVLALNEAMLPGFGRRDLRFFGIYDARNDAMARFDDPEFYTGKPHADLRRTALCTSLSVLAKSAAALLVSRHLAELPGNWDIVCVPYAGDATEADLSAFFGETKPFAPDIRVWTKKFEAGAWTCIYVTGTAMAWFFFLMDEDRSLVEGIRERFPRESCLRFQGKSLMDLVGHDWPLEGKAEGAIRQVDGL